MSSIEARDYYELSDIAIEVANYCADVCLQEQWERHEKITEVIFVERGSIQIATEDDKKIASTDEVVVINPGEWHSITPLADSKVIVFKYLSKRINYPIREDVVRK